MLQAAVGIVLFLATGYALALAFLGKKADRVERIVLGLALALTVPALVLVVLNLLLGIRFDWLSVYAVFIVLLVGSLVYWLKRSSSTQSSDSK